MDELRFVSDTARILSTLLNTILRADNARHPDEFPDPLESDYDHFESQQDLAREAVVAIGTDAGFAPRFREVADRFRAVSSGIVKLSGRSFPSAHDAVFTVAGEFCRELWLKRQASVPEMLRPGTHLAEAYDFSGLRNEVALVEIAATVLCKIGWDTENHGNLQSQLNQESVKAIKQRPENPGNVELDPPNPGQASVETFLRKRDAVDVLTTAGISSATAYRWLNELADPVPSTELELLRSKARKQSHNRR